MNIGDKAPEILGKDEQGRDIRLSDYKGRKLVLYFYPKDNTSLSRRAADAGFWPRRDRRLRRFNSVRRRHLC